MRSLPPEDYRLLPPLEPPAGYICLIRDEEYQDRFSIIRAQDPSDIDAYLKSFAFKTKVEKVFGLENGAARAIAELRQRYAGSEEWFTLSPAQLREIDAMSLPLNQRREPPPRNPSRLWRNLASLTLIALMVFIVGSMIEEDSGIFSSILVRLADHTAKATTTATLTDAPPTATLTYTPMPSATATLTDIPPTATLTDTLKLTDTATATVTLTDAPPTATPTYTPEPTATATLTYAPPTATATAMPEPSATATLQTMFVETRNNLGANALTCPRTNCEILVTLRRDAEIQALGRVEGEEVYDSTLWIQFEYNGELAYIHSELVEVSSSSQPSSSSASLERFSSSSRRYTRSTVNVRVGPGTHFPLLDSVLAGTELEITGKSGDWYLIRRGSREAYIAGWLTYDTPDTPLPVPRESQDSATQKTVVNNPIGQEAVATQVIDGDTIDVRIDGRTVRVRYIGVDTPERGEPCYTEATNYNRSLVQGKTLTLVSDTSDYGPYGRLLRYVYADGVFVNLALVQAGYAEASYYAPNGRHRHDFEVAERSAPNRGCLGDTAQTNQPQSSEATVDNCCFIGWQCNSEDDWKQGYRAFQENQCERSSQPTQSSQQNYSCNCSKTCGQMSSCNEAYFQLNNCGCGRRDGDNDGIPCESICS